MVNILTFPWPKKIRLATSQRVKSSKNDGISLLHLQLLTSFIEAVIMRRIPNTSICMAYFICPLNPRTRATSMTVWKIERIAAIRTATIQKMPSQQQNSAPAPKFVEACEQFDEINKKSKPPTQ
jgi:hypothetical protein